MPSLTPSRAVQGRGFATTGHERRRRLWPPVLHPPVSSRTESQKVVHPIVLQRKDEVAYIFVQTRHSSRLEPGAPPAQAQRSRKRTSRR